LIVKPRDKTLGFTLLTMFGWFVTVFCGSSFLEDE